MLILGLLNVWKCRRLDSSCLALDLIQFLNVASGISSFMVRLNYFYWLKKTQHITIFLGHRFFLSLIRACKTLWFCERNKIPNFKQEMCNDFSKLWFSHKIRKNIPYTIPSPLTLLQKSWKLSLTHVFYLLLKQPTRSNSVPERFIK